MNGRDERPSFYDPSLVGEIRRSPYAEIAEAAARTRRRDDHPASEDRERTALLLIDVQNTFCLPGFELFVSGRSGRGAVDDCQRITELIYDNARRITRVIATMDTHRVAQVFHPFFLVDGDGEHPAPYTTVETAHLREGRWRFNAALADDLGVTRDEGQARIERYVEKLESRGRYQLTIWPYHAMLGGISHALVAAVDEAVFYHAILRESPPLIRIKGTSPWTEHYSALGPEVPELAGDDPSSTVDDELVSVLAGFDRILVAGEAKSHCVAWTVRDLLDRFEERDPALIGRVHLLEDCSSPVVIPGGADFTDAADAAYASFAMRGARIVEHSDAFSGPNDRA